MKKILCAIMLAGFFSLPPALALASTPVQKTFTGTVSKMYGSGMYFNTASGATYSVDIANASLVRKNGSPMLFSEYIVGDKIEVKGTLWYDNSISATSIRDLTLYAHTGTFSGKITSIDPAAQSFVLQSSQPLSRTIYTNSLTTFKKNSSGATFANLEIGMTATVKGVWERTGSPLTATNVDAKLRLVSIEISGEVMLTNPSSITVIYNNTIYGVDASQAVAKNKLGKTIAFSQIKAGHTVKVTGKHVSGSVQIIASTIKDLSITQ